VELLVAVAIFAVVFVVGAEVIIQALRDSGRIAALGEARQNADRVLSLLGRSVKAARCVDWGSYSGSDCLGQAASGYFLETFSDSCLTAADKYVFLNSGAVCLNGTVITSGKSLAKNCFGGNMSCGAGVDGINNPAGWVRPSGAGHDDDSLLTSCVQVVYDGLSCGGSRWDLFPVPMRRFPAKSTIVKRLPASVLNCEPRFPA